MTRTVPQSGRATTADRDAFDRAHAPHYAELLRAARNEVPHRPALGELGLDTPEQLLGLALEGSSARHHNVPLLEVAQALAIPLSEAEQLLARDHIGGLPLR